MRKKTFLFCALSLLTSPAAKPQSFGGREDGVSYNGTNLTYYPAPTLEKCQTDPSRPESCCISGIKQGAGGTTVGTGDNPTNASELGGIWQF
jgi:hypothetical protein